MKANQRIKKQTPTAWIFVGVISLLMALVNSAAFFQGLLIRPSDTVFLGTIHYYEDYFLYLNHVFQGAHGAWLTVNRYTSEPTPASIIYWTNVLVGKVGGFAGLSAIPTYNISVILLSLATLLLSYLLLLLFFRDQPKRAFIAFLFATLATSLMNRIVIGSQIIWYPFQLWRSPHYAFDRLGGAPHQLFQTLFFLILAYACFVSPSDSRKRTFFRILSAVLAGLLTTVNPVQGGMFVGLWGAAIVLSVCFRPLCDTKNRQRTLLAAVRSQDWTKFLLVTFSIAGAFLYTYRIMDALPHRQSRIWEASQHTFTDFWFLMRSVGPVVFLALCGIVPFLRRKTPESLFSVLLVVVGYAVFLSHIPQKVGISNLRIIYPAMATFLGALAAQGTAWVGSLSSRIIPKIRSRTIETILVVLFLLVSMPTIAFEVNQKLLETADISSPVYYLPSDIYQGFVRLQKIGSFDDVVLASPGSRMDVLVPALSGHTTYSGHMLATINAGVKAQDAGQFFARIIATGDARSWLTTRNIRYVFFTTYDGDATQFCNHYPFLVPVYATGAVTIFAVPKT